MNRNRNTTIRDKHRRAIARDKPPCAYSECLYPGIPINYDGNHLDPLSFVVDHIIPWVISKDDSLENKAPMHRACNQHKSDRLPGVQSQSARIHETGRTWHAATR